MPRSIPALGILMCSMLAVASAQVMVTPEGWATTPGPAVGVYGLYAPVLVTPIAHLDTPQPAIGATSAAPGQQVGATSSPTNRILTPTPPSIVPRVVNAPPVVFATVPRPEPGTQEPVAAAESQPSGQTAEAGRVDLGIAPVAEVGAALGNRSLGQAAAAERHGAPSGSIRTLTNQDVQRLNEQTKSGTLGLQPAQSPNSTPAR